MLGAFDRLRDVQHRREQQEYGRIKPPSEIEAQRVHDEIVGEWVIEDWKDPDYGECEAHRAEVLRVIRADKTGQILSALKLHYKLNPADFINDWGYTFDPRNVEVGKAARVPFILFPKQREWVNFVMRKWRAQEPGLSEKSRDCGLSWLAVSLGCTMCLFYTGVNIGYGSRKAEYVDKRGAPKSLFFKARKFMDYLPEEFNGGWAPRKDAPLMRISFPSTESTMTGEAGDSIGRGDRASIYFVDEAAWLEQPELIEQALSQTTNCQMDISSVHGSANPFAIKRHSGKVEVFIFDWRDDPRKDQAWYDKQVEELDEITVAQEVDRDYSASVEGIIIPSAWVRAAIDAHIKLGITPSGRKRGALDVADTGSDLNAYCGAHGIVIEHLEEWSGQGSDIYATAERAVQISDDLGYRELRFDADGLGTGLNGDFRKINETRKERPFRAIGFRGSMAVHNPDGLVEKRDPKGPPGVTNKQRFFNRKAQGWWHLRKLFLNTYRAVVQGKPYDPDEIISIWSKCKNWQKLVTELSQPTSEDKTSGKMVVDKAPDGAPSPNLADAVMIRFAPMEEPLNIPEAALTRAHTQIKRRGHRQLRGRR